MFVSSTVPSRAPLKVLKRRLILYISLSSSSDASTIQGARGLRFMRSERNRLCRSDRSRPVPGFRCEKLRTTL
jgi:hypothetical protein